MSRTSSKPAALTALDVRKSLPLGHEYIDILKGIGFEIAKGEFVAIIGPSGSGKSTLLGIIAGLDNPTSGKVLIDEIDITHMSESQLAKVCNQKIGMVFQAFNLIPTLTAQENVEIPLYVGEQQRVAVARALVTKPAIVIMDEPTGNLDQRNSDTVLQLVRDLREQTNTTFIIATHDPKVASAADRSIRIVDGLIAAESGEV